MVARCISSPKVLGRAAAMRSVPSRRNGSRSMPMERMLRWICEADSSNAKYRQRFPSRQAARTIAAAQLVLPDPAVPDTRLVVPR